MERRIKEEEEEVEEDRGDSVGRPTGGQLEISSSERQLLTPISCLCGVGRYASGAGKHSDGTNRQNTRTWGVWAIQEKVPDHRIPSCMRPSTSELSILMSYSEYSLSSDAHSVVGSEDSGERASSGSQYAGDDAGSGLERDRRLPSRDQVQR